MRIRRHFVFIVFCVAISGVVILLVRGHSKATSPNRKANEKLNIGSRENVRPNRTPDTLGVYVEQASGESSNDGVGGEKEQERQANIKDRIVRLIGDEQSPAWCMYADVKDKLDENCVPILRDMLADKSYRNRWAQISHMLSWLSRRNDSKSFNSILDYIRRPDTWSEIDTPNAMDHLFAKAKALGYLGLFDEDLSTDILRSTFTKVGAEELIHEWVHLPFEIRTYNADEFIQFIRGYASRGLVLSRTPSNIAIVTASLNGEFHELKSFNYQSDSTLSNNMDSATYFLVLDSLAQNDMIDDIGLEEYMRIFNTDSWSGRIMPYLEKYLG